MSEPPANPAPDRKGRPTGAARTGRLVGVSLFWLMAVYVVGAATISVVGQLYGDGPEMADASQEAACARELSRLSGELRSRVGESWDADEAAVQGWLATWDSRITALEGQCGRLEATRKRLRVVRTEIGRLLREYHHAQQPELTRITSSLEPFAASHDTN